MPTTVVVDFPLRGEWTAPNTPGTRVPSHGTDLLGARYAYDFVGIDPASRSKRFHRLSLLQYLIAGVRLEDTYGWGRPIYSATGGTVVQAEDGMPERNPVHVARDLFVMLKNGRSVKANPRVDYRTLAGNYIMVELSAGFVVYAHAQTGSVRVSTGDVVVPGQHLANVGHSGNSTAPHLHFQIMDDPDPWKAQGVLCSFREYEVFENNAWRPVQNAIPTAEDRLRKR